MPGAVGEPDDIAALIAAVTSAYRQAAAAISALPDHDAAFRHATDLGKEIQVIQEAIGDLRALLAFLIQAETGLAVRPLAKRLQIAKSRTDQLLQRAQSLEPTQQDGDPV